jgi:hypothetical protein
MMKEDINLLPVYAQQLRIRLLYLSRLGSMLRWILLLLVLFSGALGAMWVGVRDVQRGVDRQLSSEGSEEVSVEQRVRDINQLLGSIHAYIRTHPALSLRIVDVVRLLPSDAGITAMRFDATTSSLQVEGISSARSDILEFQQALEGLAWVETVEAPLSNFATGTRGIFSFTILFKNISS